ncbi:uracil permease [Peptococcus simiae]|uniref:Uracil permease n=1 Tax=Peptococcus simiae TaxID=1643805 RepID=A0ABW9GZ46_9FIRM
MAKKFYDVESRPPWRESIPLSVQHLFAMFSASILVPTILGVNPSVVLFFNGIGTLLFIFITKGSSPAYLGSSFAFIAPSLLIINAQGMGYSYALGGFIASGLVLMLVAGLVYFFGVNWINALLPPAAMGAVVALIGLELAGTAAKMGGIVLEEGASVDLTRVAVFLITLMAAVLGSIVLRGFLALIPILLAIIIGYIAAAIVGIVDLTPVQEASWFALPAFSHPTFNWGAMTIILPATLVVISEHIGHQLVTGKIIGRNLIRKPGLHKTLFADGFSTMLSGFGGSVPTTTYGENIGVMAMTRVYSTWVIGGTAVLSILLGFIGKVSALIQSIPPEVMGGVSFLLYGMIGVSGIRLLVDAKVDYNLPRNQALTAIPFITGLSGAYVQLGSVKLTGMALATVVALFLGLLLFVLDKLNLTQDRAALK